jgi:hypothetical protein
MCPKVNGLDYFRLECYLIFLAKRQMPHLMLVRGRVAKVWALFCRTVGLWAPPKRRSGWGLGMARNLRLRQTSTASDLHPKQERNTRQHPPSIHPLACSSPSNAPAAAIHFFTISSVPRALHCSRKQHLSPGPSIHEHRPTPARHLRVDLEPRIDAIPPTALTCSRVLEVTCLDAARLCF